MSKWLLCCCQQHVINKWTGLKGLICLNLGTYIHEKALRFRGRPPDQGLCPWTPLGALPPDHRYSLALRARHGLPPKVKFLVTSLVTDCTEWTFVLLQVYIPSRVAIVLAKVDWRWIDQSLDQSCRLVTSLMMCSELMTTAAWLCYGANRI